MLAGSTAVPVATAAENVIPGNVVNTGGVNVRALNDASGIVGQTVTLDYEVSFAPAQSSNHGETTRGITIQLPAKAENVKFALIGTREEGFKPREWPAPFEFNDPYTLPEPMPMDIGDGSVGVPTLSQLNDLVASGATSIPNAVVVG